MRLVGGEKSPRPGLFPGITPIGGDCLATVTPSQRESSLALDFPQLAPGKGHVHVELVVFAGIAPLCSAMISSLSLLLVCVLQHEKLPLAFFNRLTWLSLGTASGFLYIMVTCNLALVGRPVATSSEVHWMQRGSAHSLST